MWGTEGQLDKQLGILRSKHNYKSNMRLLLLWGKSIKYNMNSSNLQEVCGKIFHIIAKEPQSNIPNNNSRISKFTKVKTQDP